MNRGINGAKTLRGGAQISVHYITPYFFSEDYRGIYEFSSIHERGGGVWIHVPGLAPHGFDLYLSKYF